MFLETNILMKVIYLYLWEGLPPFSHVSAEEWRFSGDYTSVISER